MNKEEHLSELIDEVLLQTNQGRKTKQLLENLVEVVNDHPLLFWDTPKIWPLAQASLRVLFLDVIENEEDEIVWSYKTYAYVTQALLWARENQKEQTELFDILRNRVILLHSHDDFFVEILDYFFFHNTPIEKDTDRMERRTFILKYIAKMQVQDLHVLETYDKELKNDEYLLDIEQQLLEKYQFSNEELVEAQLLSDALFKYIWAKYMNA